MEVRDVRTQAGELSFETGGVTVRYRSSLPVTGGGDAILATCLPCAMHAGEPLDLPIPVSPRLLRTQREWQAIHATWPADWGHADRKETEVEVSAPVARPGPAPAGRGVASFFSGGVDSWAVLLDEPEVTDLVFARGLDLLPGREALADETEARLTEIAGELGLPLHVVDTNVRELTDPLVPWPRMYVCVLAAIALMHQERFERVLMAGWSDYATQDFTAGNPLTDHLWSTECLEVVHAGARRSRMERVRRIAGDRRVQRSLRVCWENRDGAYNCGRCPKCLVTMLALELTGRREQFETFPAELPLDLLDEVTLDQTSTFVVWTDLHDAAVAEGRDDLARLVAPALRRTRERLGIPEGYHPRGGWEQAFAAERERADHLQAGIDRIRASRSWRLTAPLRRDRSR